MLFPAIHWFPHSPTEGGSVAINAIRMLVIYVHLHILHLTSFLLTPIDKLFFYAVETFHNFNEFSTLCDDRDISIVFLVSQRQQKSTCFQYDSSKCLFLSNILDPPCTVPLRPSAFYTLLSSA
jgi:hypothetical protein